MNKLTYLLIALMGFAPLVYSCYYDNVQELYPDGAQCDTVRVDYEGLIKPIVDASCAVPGCHVPGTGRVNLTTFQGLKGLAGDGRLEERAINRKDMPPGQPLSSCEIQYLKTWIRDGALNIQP